MNAGKAGLAVVVGLATTIVAAAAQEPSTPQEPGPKAAASKHDTQVGRSFRVPYRRTDTNHFLVRVRVNGKGPFNFLVDTGAPALYVATETARKVGIKASADEFWTPVERLDFEGGATLRDLKARVEDPFQLVGMNALGLPGASIDGILGFTMLARFRIELDPTKDVMTWTRLDFDPKEPPVPRKKAGNAPAELQAMNALGPLAKVAAAFMGKQPEVQLRPRGFLGLEFDTAPAPPPAGVPIARVVPGSPAEKVGIKPGDRLVKVGDRAVASVADALRAVAEVEPGADVGLAVARDGADKPLTLRLTAAEGF